jgi:DNA-binding PadR family transcriptional regulator
VSGRTRVYYTATVAGKKRLGDIVGEWRRITDAVAHVVKGTKYANV